MKKVSFGGKRPASSLAGTIDDWVLDREAPAHEPTKRFTIDVPVSLHKRVKSQCAVQGLVMADVMRELLEGRFPVAAESGAGDVVDTTSRIHDSTTDRASGEH